MRRLAPAICNGNCICKTQQCSLKLASSYANIVISICKDRKFDEKLPNEINNFSVKFARHRRLIVLQ
ncbi:hypothetical protein Mnod_8761 (plasmid) [Methylobacterium nodulans ORS 2060]|uniref:Uncharacterized protein n=1 Tax=Methylobacterium nodulans (strain LMG 21967 / CNCM I-2342 / ORS 2060) TaxID=460265 RepID=B8IXT3_METNO|nr:hypothetical protein Mnod_8761 [Methylobacterium nodulans ORS 2060]